VVDEVVAQVNDDVITLSQLRRESRERIEMLKQQGMTEQQAQDEVAKKQADLIATLINEKLLLQKGKELELAGDIEAEVNRRLLQIAQEQGINSIEKLYQAMRDSKLDPEEIRRTMRSEMMKQAVLQQEVDRRIYLGFSSDEVKKYYEAHLDKFRKPEGVKLSEIYLTTNGKDEAAVRARALELITQIRAGADFGALAAANSEREKNGQRTAPQDKGYVGIETRSGRWRHGTDSHARGLSDSPRRRAHARRRHSDVQRQSRARNDVAGNPTERTRDLHADAAQRSVYQSHRSVSRERRAVVETQSKGDRQERRQNRRQKEAEAVIDQAVSYPRR
jgi:hypothetical protein